MIRFTLFRQQLVLVVLVLGFELVPLGAMYFLLERAEAEHTRAEQSDLVARKAVSLYNDIYASCTSLAYFAGVNNKRYEQRYKEHTALVPLRLQELAKVCEPFPEDADALNKIKTATMHVLELQAECLQAFNERRDYGAVLALPGMLERRLLPEFDALMNNINSFTNHHLDLEVNENASNRKTKSLTNKILAAGVCLNIVVAFASVIFFSKRITDRLKILTENALRLANDAPLHPPIKGVDEISRLDMTFHRMARALLDAADKNRAIVDHNPIGLITLDNQGKIINSNGCRFFGTTKVGFKQH